MRGCGLAAPLIARLAEAGETRFADEAVWQAHLGRLGIVSPPEAGLAVIQDPVQIAIEGAQWGSIHARGFLRDAVVLNRGRNAHYWAPPAQNRTGGIPAYGSHLGCLTRKR